jgi:hypothetical protein
MKTMNETLLMILAFIAGIALGIIFFGGLWFTVKKIVAAKMPALFHRSCRDCAPWILLCQFGKLATPCYLFNWFYCSKIYRNSFHQSN